MKGSYLLVIKLNNTARISVGKKGKKEFQKGLYVYTGSALNGLEQRIQRHLRKNKKNHWHIDYLLQQASIVAIYYKIGENRDECNFAQILDKKLHSVPDFGCTDCNCYSHLFFGNKKEIFTVINCLQMKRYPINTNY
jgi:Uri superfamily endonuclease